MKISPRNSFFLALGFLSVSSVFLGTIASWILYRHFLETQRISLVVTTRNMARMLDSFYAMASPREKTRMTENLFSQHSGIFPPFAETGTYLLVMEHEGRLRFSSSRPDEKNRVPVESQADLAEPAKRALKGESGGLITRDYRGVEVLAAYALVEEAGIALVAKIDMTELRKPFLFVGLLSLVPAAAVLLMSLLVLMRHSFPILRRLSQKDESIRAIISSATDAIITIDEKRRVQTFNLAAERMFLYSAAEILGRNIKLLMPAQFARDHDEKVLAYLKTRQKKIIGTGREVVCLRKDGSEFPAHLSISEAVIDGKYFFTGILKDLSEVRELSRQIIRIQESERDRIAREIHDDLGTSLALLKFKIQSAFSPPETPGHAEKIAEFNDVVNYLNEILARTRGIARDLSPVGLKNLGFPEAVEALIARIPTGALQVNLDIEDMRNFFPENWDADIYRIFQESIANAIKHAQATQLMITARRTGNRLTIVLRDNGKGASAAELYGSGGLGLALIMQRARTAGGTAQFKSEINQGLEVTIEIHKRNEEQ